MLNTYQNLIQKYPCLQMTDSNTIKRIAKSFKESDNVAKVPLVAPIEMKLSCGLDLLNILQSKIFHFLEKLWVSLV